jgi:hypothetical protein
MTPEREASDSPSPFDDQAAAPPSAVHAGLKISIADCLFCMFAVSLSLMTSFQSWGGFENERSRYVISGLIAALGASIFFLANRIRLASRASFFSMSPGFYIALLFANFLIGDAFQYFVSFLATRHVGDPIHILAGVAPSWSAAAIALFTLLRVKLSPRWQAVFVMHVANGLLLGALALAYYFASRSDLRDPIRVAGFYLVKVWLAASLLTGLFLLIAYFVDRAEQTRREWWHHSVVVLGLLSFALPFFEDPDLMRLLQQLYSGYLRFGP